MTVPLRLGTGQVIWIKGTGAGNASDPLVMSVETRRLKATDVALPNEIHTTGRISADIDAREYSNILVYLTVATLPASGGVRVLLQGKEPVSGEYATLHSVPPYVTRLGPQVAVHYGVGILGYAPGSQWLEGEAQILWLNGVLPDTIRIVTEHNMAGSFAYSASYVLTS